MISVTTTTSGGSGSEVIIDNGAIGTSSIGNWLLTTDRKNKQYGSDYLVADGGTGSSYRWVPTITAGRYEVFVWWVKDRTAATSAPFTIVHAQGSSIVTTDQTQAGGEWSSLGVYEFNAIAGEYIEVDDSNGKTIADAVRLVEVVTGTPQVSTDIYYVHTDYLGTPKTLTDASGTPAWSASYDPFGQATVDADPDGDGSMVTFNVRFPGQYYDSETGLHYNYFRTYDPSTGRYLESDPVGLLGGLNTYGYVGGNPLSAIDPFGLEEWWGPLGGSISNESNHSVPITGTEGGEAKSETVPPGTPSDPSKSTPGIDWDFAWIDCKCWKIGPGELDIGENGLPKRGQIRHGPAPEKACKNIKKPAECESCPI